MEIKELFDYVLERVPDAAQIHIMKKNESLMVSRNTGIVQYLPHTQHDDSVIGSATGTVHMTESPAPPGEVVKAPLVGVFYTAPAPDAEPFVTVGQRVKKGDTLCIVEAMKLMNEIESTHDGVIDRILAENGSMVEFGQPLFAVKAE